MAKIVETDEGFTKTETGLVSSLFTVLVSLPRIASSDESDTTYHSERDIARGGLAIAAAAFMAGDRWGDKVPLIGGAREL